LTLDDFEGQYCSRNCVGCSASSLATAGFFCFSRFQVATHRPSSTLDCAEITAWNGDRPG